MTKTQIIGAPQFMREKGRKTDNKVLAEIIRNPGSTIHDIATRIGWSNGRVDGSVNRLVSRRKVKVQHFLRSGILVKKVYPINYVSKAHNIIEIPIKMIDEDLWKDTAQIYALSRSTIALSPVKKEDWENKSLRKEETTIQRIHGMLKIKIPDFFYEFYQLENSETSLSAIGDSAIITVGSVALPVELPSAYSEEPIPTRVFYQEKTISNEV